MTILRPWVPPDVEVDRVDFDAVEFRRALFTKGQRLVWEQATACPCRAKPGFGDLEASTGEPLMDCVACRGSGVIYADAQDCVAMLTRTSEQLRKYSLVGPSASGVVFITLLPEQVPGYLDRFTLLSGIRVHTEVKTRAATTEALRYPIVKRAIRVGAAADQSVPVDVVVGVLSCRRAGIDDVIEDNILVEGVDFQVTASGQIDWTLGDGLGTSPAVGARYGIRYYARPVFVVEDHEYVRRDLFAVDPETGVVAHQAAPVEVVCRADHLGGINPPVAQTFGSRAYPPTPPEG